MFRFILIKVETLRIGLVKIRLDVCKQVDLKLKVFRGKSARKVLVQEVKSSGATSLIVGSSKRHHTIRSSASLAKYCARNLAKDVSVFAVKSGKIMFRRVPSNNGMLRVR